MRLTKGQLDVGLFCEDIEPMLAFFGDAVGLELDCVLPVTRSLVQHRFLAAGSVVKVNHSTHPLATESRDGYRRLSLARNDISEPIALANGVELVPTGRGGVTGAAITVRVRDPEAQRRFYRDALGLVQNGQGSTLVGETLIFVEGGATSVADPQLEGRGWRYITFQVHDVDETYAEAIRGGAREAMPPTSLGKTARIAMILDPDGNWIELSQRSLS